MINIKAPQDIIQMRKIGRVASIIMKNLVGFTRGGISTKDIENKANQLMERFNIKSAFLGYKGFPASLCVSLNEELIHGIPSKDKVVESGDLVSIDLGLYNGRFYTDTAYSFCVGRPKGIVKDLLRVGRSALSQAIKTVKPAVTLGDISWTIQNIVESKGFCVVKKFVGHGIGEELHEEPEVPNFGSRGEGVKLQEGMVLAIEPMVTVDSSDVEILSDGWTVISQDRKSCVHFEHTVAVTNKGCRILTN
ncbi:MAG: type I methionyl aminopeptidase [Candidatus Omnitrophica bacterium]|nr:type I methionyl aminopeptidase [Candidatus Omnitrophota bacterium]